MAKQLQRKPNTPLQNFFCTGDYGKAPPVKKFAIRSSEPGLSANIEQRNPHP